MLHGANLDETVSARDPIAIRYRSLFRFSKELISTRVLKYKKKGNLLVVLCFLLFSPYHEGDNNGCNSTNQCKSTEDVGDKRCCEIR